MVRALLVEHHVLRRAHFKLCQALLQHLLEILLVPQSQRGINPQRQARQHKCARGFQTAVEVQRAHDSFKHTSKQALGKPLRTANSLVNPHPTFHSTLSGKFSTDAPADNVRLHLGEFALKKVWALSEQMRAHNEPQDGIAKELKALVGVQPPISC